MRGGSITPRPAAVLALLAIACAQAPVRDSGVGGAGPAGSVATVTATFALPPVPPNVVFVLLDDVGNDKIGTYGEHPEAPATPTLDALAAEGVLFRHAYTHPVCGPTRAGLLTGRLALRTGMGDNVQGSARGQLSPDELLIPEMLRHGAHAWTSAVVGKWHLAHPSVPNILTHPLDAGFDVYRGTIANLVYSHAAEEPGNYWSWERIRDGRLEHLEDYATLVTMDDAREVLAELPEPFFLYLPVHAPHDPFHVPPDALLPGPVPDAPDATTRHDLMVQSIDTALGAFLDDMDPALRARTLVMVMGDNGTPRQAMNPPSAEGKLSIYESGINVPLIVSGPLVASPGRESQALVSIEDIFPTLAELAGIDTEHLTRDDGAPLVLDGHSLLPLLTDPHARSEREMVFQERFFPPGPPPWNLLFRAVRDARYKYVEVHTREGDETGLFDLEGRTDDGPNLLERTLSGEEEAALVRLRDELRRLEALPMEEGWR